MKRFYRFLQFIFINNPIMALLSCIIGAAAILFSSGLYGLSAYLISFCALHPPFEFVMLPVVGVRFFGIGRAAFRYIERLVSHDTTFRVLRDLRVYTYKGIEAKLPDFKDCSRRGSYVSKIISDVENLQEAFLRIAYPYMVAVIILIAGFCGLWLLNPYLSYGFAVIYLTAVFITPPLLNLLARGAWKESVEIKRHMYNEFIEFSYGLAEILSNIRGKTWEDKLALIFKNDASAARRSAFQGAAANALSIFFPNLSLGVCLVISCWLVAKGALAGELISVAPLCAAALFEASLPLFSVGGRLEKTKASLSNIFGDSSQLLDISKIKTEVKGDSSPKNIAELTGKNICLSNVSFSYLNDKNVINNFNMELKQGQIKALLGPSGIGKSTIVNLILGFIDGYTGTIETDGIDIKELPKENLRKLFSVVDQKPFFFNTSIRDNLKIANPTASDADIYEALKKVNIYESVIASSKGLDTNVGEMGNSLSGGELQRLSIARALIKDAPFFIFDEPTAGLDTVNEKGIMELIKELSKEKAVLLITHRLVMMDKMDEVIRLG